MLGPVTRIRTDKLTVSELEGDRKRLEARNENLLTDLDASRDESRHLRHEMEKQKWDYQRQIDELNKTHKDVVEDLSRPHRDAVDDLSRELDHLKSEEAREHEQKMEGDVGGPDLNLWE